MKPSTRLILAAGFLGITGSSFGQAAAVIDEALINQTRANTQDIMGVLQQQLQEAQKQTENMNEQLKRMGDPSAVNLPALNTIKQDMAKSQQAAMDGADRETRLRGVTGREAFGDNSFGLTEAVGATYKLKDGTEAERDPEKYKGEAALMQELNGYLAKSKENDERKAALMDECNNALESLKSAPDVATTMKLNGLITVLTGQIAECSAASTKAKADYDATKEKLNLAAQIAMKAKAEGRTLQSKANKSDNSTAKADSAQSTKNALIGSGRLPWGKKEEDPAATVNP